ncbi:vancomycin high temperature exclusion protein [Vibrio aerogenes CECT 7868]|uniref:Vancomycin high temperature exclusion protein n=1 Tax=Vibrio aerogenes CECT 7868 TaxID=1216006 RepID=A0A1M6DQM5_9VIBR|nr:ElyC/SanA/YdcF family protein [Vibrio aerogenes]SHI75473.1 vancomycin high temperature exclusion protein [Vibrio aerogenes CECT 7868]
MGTEKPTYIKTKATVASFLSGYSWSRMAKMVSMTLIIIGMLTLLIDRWVSWQTQDHIVTDSENLPPFKVAVVLGTSKYLGKTLNDYYTHRINAAIRLYREGKIHQFLLSGDNAHRSYNEPWTMKRDLLKAGIPEQKIALDYAGFRTLDSIVRTRKIFDTNHFLIITQQFHCERALFIAKHRDIDATCFAVPGLTHGSGIKIRLREAFARVKAVLDLFILNAKPKFLGPKEPIIVDENPVQPPLPVTTDTQEEK